MFRLYAQSTSKFPSTSPNSGGEDADFDEEKLTKAVQQEAERWSRLSPEDQRQDLETELKEFEWLLTQKEASELTPEFQGYEVKIAEMLSILKPAGVPLSSDSDRLLHDSDRDEPSTFQISQNQKENFPKEGSDRRLAEPKDSVRVASEKLSSLMDDLRPSNMSASSPSISTKTQIITSQAVDRELEDLLNEDANRLPSTELFVAPEDDSLVSIKSKSTTSPQSNNSFLTLFEDDFVLAVGKPPGVVVIPSRAENTEKDSMLAILRERHVSLKAVLTLDSQSSGVVLFAKTAAAFSILAKNLETGQLTNTFVGWVEGKLNKQQGNINIPLQSGRKSRMRPADGWVAGPEHKLADSTVKRNVPVHLMANAATVKAKFPAVTKFVLSRVFQLPKGQTLSRVLFKPLTHRQHQVRVHMRAVDLPLLVDTIYGYNSALRANALGPGSPSVSTLTLHNMHVVFMHPVTGVRTKVSCSLSSCNPELKRLDDWLTSVCPKDDLADQNLTKV